MKLVNGDYMRRIIKADRDEIYGIDLAEDALRANERLAMENQLFLRRYGVKAIDILGSVGIGETSLIEKLFERLAGEYRVAAIAGDLTSLFRNGIGGKVGYEQCGYRGLIKLVDDPENHFSFLGLSYSVYGSPIRVTEG